LFAAASRRRAFRQTMSMGAPEQIQIARRRTVSTTGPVHCPTIALRSLRDSLATARDQ
jgi:hypothetical protein